MKMKHFSKKLVVYSCERWNDVKRRAIVTYGHGIYELPHKFPNDVRRRILGN